MATRPTRSSSDPSSQKEGGGGKDGGEGGERGGERRKSDVEEVAGGKSAGEVFVRSFIFHPELPIRIDYLGKHFQNEAMVRTCVDSSPD